MYSDHMDIEKKGTLNKGRGFITDRRSIADSRKITVRRSITVSSIIADSRGMAVRRIIAVLLFLAAVILFAAPADAYAVRQPECIITTGGQELDEYTEEESDVLLEGYIRQLAAEELRAEDAVTDRNNGASSSGNIDGGADAAVTDGNSGASSSGNIDGEEDDAEDGSRISSRRPAYAGLRRDRLSGAELAIYNILEKKISGVASGETASTVFMIPVSDVFDKTTYTASELGVDAITSGGAVTPEAQKAFYAKFSYDFDRILGSLLADHPYELYWYDKAEGVRYYSAPFEGYEYGEDHISLRSIAYFKFEFLVSSYYNQQGSMRSTKVYRSKTAAAAAAASSCAEIISSNADRSDAEKLAAYRDAICDLTSYDSSLAYNAPYGDPWQIIYVFDGDPDTRVVCEGYAKSFQFLCSLSSFDSRRLEVCSATGVMHVGQYKEDHMWNIVTMPDGRNYLVDVTNSDQNTIGQGGWLFLRGFSGFGSVDEGYYYACDAAGDLGVRYTYDDETRDLFTEDELTLSADDYDDSDADIDSCSHILTRHGAELPDCGNDGSREYYECEVCGRYFSDEDCTYQLGRDNILIPATGDHSWDDGTITAEAGCEEPGKITYACTVCGAVKEEEIPAAGHEWGDGVVTAGPTCTAAGAREYTCYSCGMKRTEEIPAAGHDWSDGVVTAEPTCTGAGAREYTCSSCGVKRTEEIPAAGHDWGEWIVTGSPTCTEKGSRSRVCRRDPSHIETGVIAASGHIAGRTVRENEIKPTYTSGGSYDEVVYCGRPGCNDVISRKHRTVARLTVRNGDVVSSGGSKYKVISASSGTVSLVKAKNTKKVTVPATVRIGAKSYKVIRVDAGAFTGSRIRTVTVGKNVKKLQKRAFASSKATKIILKTRLLNKKSIRYCLKGSKVRKVKVSINRKLKKKFIKKYKKIFTKKNAGKKVSVT